MEAILKEIIDTYPEICRSEPTSWVVFNDSLSKREHGLLEVCHANMQYHKAGQYDQCVTSIPRDQPLDLAYIRFLIDGPFRSFRDRISLETFKVEDVEKYYLRMTKLDTWPANVLYNLCIATRVPVEFSFFLPAWGKMVAAGVNDALAFIVTSHIAFTGDYWDERERKLPDCDPWELKLDRFGCPTGHFWFDPTADWKTLLSGEPVVKLFSPNYKGNPKGCRPCNIIWGQSNRTEAATLTGKTVKELSDYFGLTKSDEKNVLEQMVEDYVPLPPVDDDDELFGMDDNPFDDFDFDDDDDDF